MRSSWRAPLGAAALCVVLFSAGYLTAVFVRDQDPPPIVVEYSNDNENYSTVESEGAQGVELEQESTPSAEGQVVASVNSTKYHFLHCPGAKQIKEENKVYFSSAREAQLAGFVLAGNCK